MPQSTIISLQASEQPTNKVVLHKKGQSVDNQTKGNVYVSDNDPDDDSSLDAVMRAWLIK